jgi:hypothetical protein
MIQDYSTVSLVLSGIMPCVDPVDYADLFCRRRDVSTFRGMSESRAKTLLSVALAGGSQEAKWRDLIDEVDAFVRAEGLHGRPVQRLQSLLKVCDPDGDGWVVTIAILVSIYMELRRLPIDQGIDMWEALYSYRNRGLPVIPENDKRPCIRGWPEYAYELPPESDVIRWRKMAFNGIGLVLGPASDLCVIDIDVREKFDGRDAWPVDPKHPVLARTRSGGYHIYYVRHGQRGTTWLGDGVEFLGDERKVTLAPSGGAYRFLNQDWKALPSLDLGFRTLETERPAHRPDNRPAGPLTDAYVAGIVRNKAAAVEGERVNTAVSFVSLLIHKGQRDYDKIRDAVRAWNFKNDPPLTDEELERDVFGSIERFINRLDS